MKLMKLTAILTSIILGASIPTTLATTTEVRNEDPIYVIMDASIEFIDDVPVFHITMPSGDTIMMMSTLEDLPDEISEVVIETNNLDDTSTFKIVGMR